MIKFGTPHEHIIVAVQLSVMGGIIGASYNTIDKGVL